MNAIELLDEQHEQLEELFERAGVAGDAPSKAALFEKIAAVLAIHIALEEKVFHPAMKARRIRDLPLESLEKHVAIRRVLSDLLELDPGDESFDTRLSALEEEVGEHVEEQRSNLFPQLKQVVSSDELEELGEDMESMAADLEETEPRLTIRGQTEKSAPVR